MWLVGDARRAAHILHTYPRYILSRPINGVADQWKHSLTGPMLLLTLCSCRAISESWIPSRHTAAQPWHAVIADGWTPRGRRTRRNKDNLKVGMRRPDADQVLSCYHEFSGSRSGERGHLPPWAVRMCQEATRVGEGRILSRNLFSFA